MNDEMNHADWKAHAQNLSALLFDSSAGRLPDWLSQQALNAAKRYAGLRTTPEFQTSLSGISQRGSEPFEIFVVGEGNFGKSTLINALLGEEVAKVNILAETRTFHRLILSRNPSQTARLMVHLDPKHHEWLRKEIGVGKPAQGFFEVMEHKVPVEVARRLVAEEADRAKKTRDLYKPAIFEFEQEIRWTPSSPFPERVRIVDTQGLNQQLPEDMLPFILANDGKNTSEKVVSRLNQHVRGRHMLWQYRRCDAVLWLLRANQIQSAATKALFDVFSAYGKKTLLVVTRIDESQPRDHQRILQSAEDLYRNRVDGIVPGMEGWLWRELRRGRARCARRARWKTRADFPPCALRSTISA
jgi:GTP-binding protein EngB required for normal cell division